MLTRFVLAIYIGRMGKRSVKSVNISEAVAELCGEFIKLFNAFLLKHYFLRNHYEISHTSSMHFDEVWKNQ